MPHRKTRVRILHFSWEISVKYHLYVDLAVKACIWMWEVEKFFKTIVLHLCSFPDLNTSLRRTLLRALLRSCWAQDSSARMTSNPWPPTSTSWSVTRPRRGSSPSGCWRASGLMTSRTRRRCWALLSLACPIKLIVSKHGLWCVAKILTEAIWNNEQNFNKCIMKISDSFGL